MEEFFYRWVHLIEAHQIGFGRMSGNIFAIWQSVFEIWKLLHFWYHIVYKLYIRSIIYTTVILKKILEFDFDAYILNFFGPKHSENSPQRKLYLAENHFSSGLFIWLNFEFSIENDLSIERKIWLNGKLFRSLEIPGWIEVLLYFI